MKKLLYLSVIAMFGLWTKAANANQFHFSATNLPSRAGQYYCSYFSTNNINVPAMLTLTTNSGGPLPTNFGAIWDFSQPQQTNESVLRTDIISPTNGTDGSYFTNATYAEQDSATTSTSTNAVGWRYYSITNQGRIYYGLYTPNTAADGLALFDQSNVDIPATVTNGQTWTRTTSWNSTVYSMPIYYQFSDTATVDAQGTLALPGIGALPALRVHEIHGYIGTLIDYGVIEIVTNQYYYWLVPELGVAAQITMYGDNQYDGETPPFTNSVERMFFASYYTNVMPQQFTNTGNLHIQLLSGSAVLNWIPFTNSTTSQVSTDYQVQAVGSLSNTNWQLLGLTSTTNWSETLSPTQRFYRVIGFP